MKKVLCVFCFLLTLEACVSVEEKAKLAEAARIAEAEKTAQIAAEKKQQQRENIQKIEQGYADARSPLTAALLFSRFYMSNEYKKNICEDGYLPWHEKITEEDGTETKNFFTAKLYTTPSVNLKCFLADNYTGWLDSSDECILERRNTKESVLCHYNYKKYLPENSKVKTEEDFLYLVAAYNVLYQDANDPKKCTFCAEQPEQTTVEIAECTKKAEIFLNQISSKTVPLCKNTIKKEYMDFLKDGIENYYFLSELTKAEINNNTYGTKAYLLNGIYSASLQESWENSIRTFGITHFCSVDGYKKDVVNLNKTSKKKRGGLVPLN